MTYLLEFNIKVMRVFFLWPSANTEESIKKHIYKDIFLALLMTIIIIGLFGDVYMEVFLGLREDITGVTDSIIAIGAALFALHCIIYLRIQRRNLMKLAPVLKDLGNISVPPDIEHTEEQARLLTKVFVYYGLVAATIYSCLPLLFLNDCKEKKAKSTLEYQVPCGLYLRVWYPFNYDTFPGLLIVSGILVFGAYIFANVFMAILLLQCALIMHCVAHLRNLKENFQKAFLSENQRRNFSNCIRYHIGIIEFCKMSDKCFTEMSFMHSFTASLILSILAFQIKMISTLYDSCRFFVHLFAWLSLVFFRCYMSQRLIDASLSVGDAVYNAEWQGSDISVQRDMVLVIMRAQRPLVVSRGKYGILSLEVFYSTMAAAYTYFTLLTSSQNT